MKDCYIFKNVFAILAAAAMSVFGVQLAAAAESPLSGEGTENSPFVVSTADELLQLGGYNEVGYVSLAKDIDMSGRESLPCVIKKLTGEFNGNGHKISGLKLVGSGGTVWDKANTGFVSSLGGSIKNLKLENISVLTEAQNNNLGALAGTAEGGCTIENCIVSGSVESILPETEKYPRCDYIGGAIGYIMGDSNKANVSFIGCTFDVNTVGSKKDYAAGLAAFVNNANITISRCAVLGEVSADSSKDNGFAGGMIGQTGANADISINNSYFAGSVQGAINKIYSIAYLVSGSTINGGKLAYGENCFYISTAPKANPDGLLKTTITGSAEEKTADELKNLELSGFEIRNGEFGGFPVPKWKAAEEAAADNSISLTADRNASVTAAKSSEVYVVFAEYASGCLKNCEIVKESLEKGEKKEVTSPQFFKTAAAENIKALLWSVDMVPLAR